MRIIEDAHVHTKASDGNWRPSQVVEEAKRRGLQSIAITDHDTTFGVLEAQEIGRKIGLNVFNGIEINTFYYDGQILLNNFDILGLKIDLELIQPFEKKLSTNRYHALNSMIERFNQYISVKKFTEDNKKKRYPIQKLKIINIDDIIKWKCEWNDYEMDLPYISDLEVAFYVFNHFPPKIDLLTRNLRSVEEFMLEIKREYPFLFQRDADKPSCENSIEVIKMANGIAVWTHPGRYQYYQKEGLIKEWELDENEWLSQERIRSPFAVAKFLAMKGLDGIELYYYKGNDELHGTAQERINKYFKLVAERLNLIVTYGSDCHGPRLREPYMGLFGSTNLIL